MININCHSSINIKGSKNLWFDPFKISEDEDKADIIFLTHSHYDHMSIEDISKVKGNTTLIVAPYNVFKHADYIMSPGDTINIDGICVEAIPAYNIDKPFHLKRNNWLGYKITMDNTSYYICGDTDITKEAESVQCDILLVPCGGTYTMDSKSAADLANRINPKIAIPTHYGSVVGSIDAGKEFMKYLNPSIECTLLI